jgi:phage head maturation protease
VYEDFKTWPEAMEFSFAFDLFDRPKGYDYDETGIRHLFMAKGLYDVSNVTKGMNPATELLAVKASEEILDAPPSLSSKRAAIDIAEARLRLS